MKKLRNTAGIRWPWLTNHQSSDSLPLGVQRVLLRPQNLNTLEAACPPSSPCLEAPDPLNAELVPGAVSARDHLVLDVPPGSLVMHMPHEQRIQVTSLVPHLYQRCPMSNSLLCPTTHLKKDAESVTLLGAAVYPPSPSKRKTAARIPPSSGETPPLSFDTVT